MTDTTRGGPYGLVAPKRSFDEVPIEIDWHDYVANVRLPGTTYAQNVLVRPLRAEATGLQYRCTTAGTTSGQPSGRLRWPTTAGGAVTDGSVVWTAEALTSGSLRSTISTSAWPAVTGVTVTDQGSSDLRYRANVAGGRSGQTYEIRHRVTLANGEDKEAVAILPVQD